MPWRFLSLSQSADIAFRVTLQIILAPIGEEVPKAKDEMMEIETEGRRQTRGEIEA